MSKLGLVLAVSFLTGMLTVYISGIPGEFETHPVNAKTILVQPIPTIPTVRYSTIKEKDGNRKQVNCYVEI